jgi:small subunit ribosomal protein S4e
LTGGNNIGRIGILQSVEKHPGSYDIGHIKDTNGASFATRHSNIFIIGDGKNPAITIPRGEGLKVGIIEEKNNKQDEESEAEEVVEEEK